MKKITILMLLAASLALTAAGCKSTGSDEAQSTEDTKSVEYQLEHYAENADEAADSSKIEGTVAKLADEQPGKAKGKIDDAYTVEVKNVVVTNHDNRDLAIVDFTLKNGSKEKMTFTSAIQALAYQDGLELVPAALETSLEGYSSETTAQQVEPGEKITVQKAYVLQDTTTPLLLEVLSYKDESTVPVTVLYNIAE